MRRSALCFVVALAALCDAEGQGTFVYDQQSSTDESPLPLVGPIIQQQLMFYGQSFTPGLNGVDFIRLKVSDANFGNSLGAVLYVNLRTNSISGGIAGS